jgi:hypothetical protein
MPRLNQETHGSKILKNHPKFNSLLSDEQAANKNNTAFNILNGVTQAAVSGIPQVEGLSDDGFAGWRGLVFAIGVVAQSGAASAARDDQNNALQYQNILAQLQGNIQQAVQINTQNYQVEQQLLALQDLLSKLPAAQVQCQTMAQKVTQDAGVYSADLAKGGQIGQQRATFDAQSGTQLQSYQYQNATYRIFQNDAIQKYQAQLALAQRYVYLTAIAYDFETELLGGTSGSGRQFLSSIVKEQSLGEMNNGQPVNGVGGLADELAQLGQNFTVLKGQLGFNNPQTGTGKFSLRYSLFRQHSAVSNALPVNSAYTNDWRTELQNHVVPDLWQVPEFVRYCRPFAPQSAGPQPGIVIKFGTTISYGLNFFGWPLSGGDSDYDPTFFSTKVRSVGAWFTGYDTNGLAITPNVYLIPVGADVLRTPSGDLSTRQWQVVDQQIPVPFQLGASTLASASYIPSINSVSGSFGGIRQFSSFPAFLDEGNAVNTSQVTTSSRLVGRSVWNTEWMLIIPGQTLLADPNAGLQDFINTVSDIKIFFQTYSYSGN